MKSPMPAPSCEFRVPPAVMPWFSSSPPGLSRRWIFAKYAGRRARPTCSNMPTDAILSHGSSSGSAREASRWIRPPPAQPALLDQPVHVGVLVLRQRDAGGVDAVVLGRPQQQPAPAGADVEE